jgi:hypothetical protein
MMLVNKGFKIILFAAAISSLFTLLFFGLMNLPFVPFLVILQIILTTSIVVTLLEAIQLVIVNHIEVSKRLFSLVIVSVSVILLLCSFLKFYSIIRSILSLLVCSFLPGFVIVRFTRMCVNRSIIEYLALSYVLSLPITAMLGMVVFFSINNEFRDSVLALTYVFISLTLLIFEDKFSNFGEHKRFIKIDNTFLLFLILTIFFSFYIFSFYPQMAYVIGADIVRHFGAVQQIVRNPRLLQSFYSWFIFYEAVFYILGDTSLEDFQTLLAFSSVTMMNAFYAMAFAYLQKVDRRLPIIATAFWFVFGGFGWLLYLKEILSSLNKFSELLLIVDNKSYLDISIPKVWFWFRPMNISFSLLFILLYLLKRDDITTSQFVFAYSLLVLALIFYHIPELFIIVIVLTLITIFNPSINLRLKDAVLSTIIGIFFALLMSRYLYSQLTYTYHLLSLLLVMVLCYLLLVHNWRGFQIPRTIKKVIIYFGIVTYLAGIMSWLSNPDFSITDVAETLFVPWMMYPVRLGLPGLLGLIGLLNLYEFDKENLSLFAYMFFSSIIFGRFLSYINVYLFPTNFYEQRFIQAALLPSISILAALAIKPVMVNISTLRNIDIKRLFAITTVISLIVIIGTNSMLLAYYYHKEITINKTIGDYELRSIRFLLDALHDDPKSPILTLTTNSMYEVEFAGPVLIVNPLHEPAWASLRPEIPLMILLRDDPRFTAPYIYLHERDKTYASNRFPESILFNHIIPLLPLVYKNEKVELYKMFAGSPPLMNSSTALLMPYDSQEVQTLLPVVLLLSHGGFEYTTMLDSDVSVLNKKVIIIPKDYIPGIIDRLLNVYVSGTEKKLIVFNTEGYGSIGEKLFLGKTVVNISTANGASFLLPKGAQSNIIFHEPIGNLTEFVITNLNLENNFTVISDDEQSGLWTSVGLGRGNISAPILTNDYFTKISGNNSLKIQVANGSYAQWQISYLFKTPQDWRNYDFITFYWYGYGDGKSYIIELLAPDSSNYFWFMFIDEWKGWKKVIIPLKMPETGPGPYPTLHKPFTINGVKIAKYIVGKPSFLNVKRVNIRLSSANVNVQGTWFLDRFGVDVGRWIQINVSIFGIPSYGEIKLYSYCAGTRSLIATLTSINETLDIPASNFCFLKDLKGDILFGRDEKFKVSLQRTRNETQLKILVKLPPGELSRMEWIKIIIEFPINSVKVNRIESKGLSSPILLPFDLEVIPYKCKNNIDILSYFSYETEKIPFIVRGKVNGTEITYVNIYPLIPHINGRTANEVFAYLSTILNTEEPDLKKFSKSDYKLENILLFKKGIFEGNIVITTNSLIFPENKFVRVRFDEYAEGYRVRFIEFIGVDNIVIETNRAEFSNGLGFYAQLTLVSPYIELHGEKIEMRAILENGDLLSLNGSKMLKFKIEDVILAITRSPSLSILGNVTLNEAYSLHEMYRVFRAYGSQLGLRGYLNFTVISSDVYTIAKDIKLQGTVKREPPILRWDELNSIRQSIPWFILSTIVLLFAVLYCRCQSYAVGGI